LFQLFLLEYKPPERLSASDGNNYANEVREMGTSGKTLLYKLQRWGYSNDFLRAIWRFLTPLGLRQAVGKFIIHYDAVKKLKILSKIIVGLIEDETISFDKSLEVLRFLKSSKEGMNSPDFIKIWLEKVSGAEIVFNFNGALLPKSEESSPDSEMFADIFLFHVFFADNYGKDLVEMIERDMPEGPYGYTDGGFDVSVKKGDVVIDAGAFIGDFSAYAAAKGAVCYAFEPTETTFQLLQKTAELNGGKIIPVQKGLGNIEGEVEFFINNGNAGGNAINVRQGDANRRKKNISTIKITTLDTFVREQGLTKVDFIKADIEGAERDMLAGARNMLKTFTPKLAICTYHLPDDPQVLERLILDANPNYKVRQGPKKLYASV
jgi:FkbM family methyltransferase